MKVRVLLSVASATVGLVVGGGSAAYAAEGRIARVTSGDRAIEMVFTGLDLPANAELNHRQISVSIDGKPVGAVAVPLTASTSVEVQRTLVLAVDVSGSMKGDGLEGAKKAASGLVAELPADVEVGLVTFADTARIVVPATTDHRKVSAAIAKLQARGETALYDGVLAAVKTVGTTGERRILLLSDGADTVSTRPEITARTAVRQSKVSLDVVGFRTEDAVLATLQKLAMAGSGKVVKASSTAAVASLFQATARDYTRQLIIRVPVPEEASGRQVSVRVDVKTTAGGVVSDEVSVAMPVLPVVSAPASTLRPANVANGWIGSAESLRWAYGLLFVGLLLLVILAVRTRLGRSGGPTQMRRLMSLYTLDSKPTLVEHESTMLGDSQVAKSAMELAGRVASKRGLEERLGLLLDRAAVPLKPSEWILIQGGVSLGSFAVIGGLTGTLVVPMVFGVIVGIFAPNAVLRFKARRRQAKFIDSLPDTLQLISGSLSAGYSLPQAIDSVVREGTEPTAAECGRALAEARLGVSIEDALDNVADRMGSRDFHWVVMAIRVQHEVGGNLAEVLTTVSVTIRDRQRLHRQVRALSAEGRLSAYVLIGLPITMAVYMLLFRGDYIRPLYTRGLGIAMLATAVTLLVSGAFMMKKLIKVEV